MLIVRHFDIDGVVIGRGHEPYLIMEIGSAHNNIPERVDRFVEMAVECKVHALKTQAFSANTLVDPVLAPAWHARACLTAPAPYILEYMRDACKKAGITFLCTPHDEYGLSLLEELDVSAYKVGSGEWKNLPFIEKIAQKKKPMIVSLGLHSTADASELKVILSKYIDGYAFLYCVTAYPATAEHVHPNYISLLHNILQCPIGYSDHTIGVTSAIMAVAHGASIIERHVDLLDNANPGQDRGVSCIGELSASIYFSAVRDAYAYTKAKGGVSPHDEQVKWATKGIIATENIAKGMPFTQMNTAVMRPGGGLPGWMYPTVLKQNAAEDIPAHTQITSRMCA